MAQGKIIGYDINSKVCQISVFDEKTGEPETVEVGRDNYQIPMAVNYYKEEWTYGKNAIRMDSVKGSTLVDNIFEKALKHERVLIEGEEYDSIWILAEFIGQTLKEFEEIEQIVFTVPKMSEDIRYLLKGMGQKLGVSKEKIYVQDYKESFCHYMFNQPKELWQYEAALFYCDRNVIRAYMLRELKTGTKTSGKECFVTVEEVADAEMEELEQVYPVLSIEKGRAADEHFRRFIQNVFNKKSISSVFLTGDGFENNWYPNSLRVLCNGRRAFMGNNLYSKGACYTALDKAENVMDGLVYLDDSKLTDQISIKMRVSGEEILFPLVTWGAHWYESDKEWEVLMENNEDIELYIDSLSTGKRRTETVSLKGLPERSNYALRLRISTMFLNDKICKITFEDVGFGEFFSPTGFEVEKVIELGGSNGQFNSLS